MTDKRHIGFYIENYLYGGLEKMLIDVVNGLNSQQFDTTIFYAGDPSFPDRFQKTGGKRTKFVFVPVFTLTRFMLRWNQMSCTNLLYRLVWKLEKILGYLLFSYNVRRCRKVLRNRPVDVLHAFNGGYPAMMSNQCAIVAAAIEHVPLKILSVTGLPVQRKVALLDPLIDERVAAAASTILCVSAAVADNMVNYRKMPKQRLRVIHCGIRPPSISQPDQILQIKKEFNIKGKVIGNVSMMERYKGQHLIIQAMALLKDRYPDLQCILAGEGREKQALEQQVKVLGLESRVIFPGFVKDRWLLISMLDIFVHPPLEDGFPYVILEAMALAKPIISSRIGGVPEQIVDGETGCLIAAGDVRALANNIDELLSDTRKAESMGHKACQRVNEFFTLSTMISEFGGLYDAGLPGKDVLLASSIEGRSEK